MLKDTGLLFEDANAGVLVMTSDLDPEMPVAIVCRCYLCY